MQILDALKINQPLILLSSFTMIIATFLSNNVTQYSAFENSAYAAFSFFAAFVASMIYSFAKSDIIENIIEKIIKSKRDEDDKDYYISMITVLQNTTKIITYVCFIIGIVFIIFMAYELSSSFPKFSILYNLIINIGVLGAPLTSLYYIRFARKLFLAYYVKVSTIMFSMLAGYQSIHIGFIILEIVTNIDYMDIIGSDFHRWYTAGLIAIVMCIVKFNAVTDKKSMEI